VREEIGLDRIYDLLEGDYASFEQGVELILSAGVEVRADWASYIRQRRKLQSQPGGYLAVHLSPRQWERFKRGKALLNREG
jgi:hypothetical protein